VELTRFNGGYNLAQRLLGKWQLSKQSWIRTDVPAKDLYHDAVKSALIKDGWNILADPYRIQYKDLDLYADLAAERPFAAEREGQKIVVEIKSFVGRSLVTDFHLAIGQYKVYQVLLSETASEYDLYLAI
jgi:XisH protein